MSINSRLSLGQTDDPEAVFGLQSSLAFCEVWQRRTERTVTRSRRKRCEEKRLRDGVLDSEEVRGVELVVLCRQPC